MIARGLPFWSLIGAGLLSVSIPAAAGPRGYRVQSRTLPLADVMAAAWSPDGRRLAMVSEDASQHGWTLIVTDARRPGSARRTLYVAPRMITSLRWSPSGERIACLVWDGRSEEPQVGRLAVIEVGSGKERTLIGSGVSGVDWSPRGGRLVAAVGSEMVTVSASTGRSRRLARVTGTIEQPAHSPDGRQIAFVVRRPLRGAPIPATFLCRLDARHGSVHAFTTPSFYWYDSAPLWSADGRTLAFTRDHYVGPSCPSSFLYRVPTAGGAPRPIGWGRPTAWLDSGRALVAADVRGDCGTGGLSLLRLTDTAAWEQEVDVCASIAAVSPDGRSVVIGGEDQYLLLRLSPRRGPAMRRIDSQARRAAAVEVRHARRLLAPTQARRSPGVLSRR